MVRLGAGVGGGVRNLVLFILLGGGRLPARVEGWDAGRVTLDGGAGRVTLDGDTVRGGVLGGGFLDGVLDRREESPRCLGGPVET